jgi:gliding motility-associated-like protein
MRLKIFTPVQVNAGEDQTISYDTVAIIHAEANGGSGDYRYEWEPESLFQNDTSMQTQTLPLKNNSLFIVTVTDKVTGCIASDSIKIYVGPGEGLEGCIVIHNVITPNGDGLNDTWIIDCIENFPDNTVQIFNRWGEMVNNYYHYDNRTQVWDGTNYKGELLPAGTYYYVLKIKNVKTRTGWVLLRGGAR